MRAGCRSRAGARRLRVLYLIDTLEVGGAERSLLDIARRLEDAEVAVCHLYPGSTLRPEFERAGVRVHSLNVGGRYGFVSAVRRVRALVRSLQPDVMHVMLFRAAVVGRAVARREGVPLVDSLVNDSYADRRWRSLPLSGRVRLALVRAIDRATARWVTRFVAISRAAAAAGRASLGVSDERCQVIYRGRDPAVFAGGEREAVREQLGIEPGATVLLNVARLLPRKGQAELVRSMPYVLAHAPGTVLLVAGEGRFRGELEALIEREHLGGRVRLLGTRSDVPSLLCAADAFVFPSHYEGLGGALVEAMLAGAPVVASDIDVFREVVRDGTSGTLFEAGNARALAEAVLSVLRDPARARAMAGVAREDARRLFDIAAVAREHRDLYGRLVAVTHR